MERVENVANLPSHRPILDPPADFAARWFPVASVIGNATIHIVRPVQDRLCEIIRLRQPSLPPLGALVDALDPSDVVILAIEECKVA